MLCVSVCGLCVLEQYADIERWMYDGIGTTTYTLNAKGQITLWSQQDQTGTLGLTDREKMRLRSLCHPPSLPPSYPPLLSPPPRLSFTLAVFLSPSLHLPFFGYVLDTLFPPPPCSPSFSRQANDAANIEGGKG